VRSAVCLVVMSECACCGPWRAAEFGVGVVEAGEVPAVGPDVDGQLCICEPQAGYPQRQVAVGDCRGAPTTSSTSPGPMPARIPRIASRRPPPPLCRRTSRRPPGAASNSSAPGPALSHRRPAACGCDHRDPLTGGTAAWPMTATSMLAARSAATRRQIAATRRRLSGAADSQVKATAAALRAASIAPGLISAVRWPYASVRVGGGRRAQPVSACGQVILSRTLTTPSV
jgi:hypothetical protein